MEAKIVLFGAGVIAKRAISFYGKNNIRFIVDNNTLIQGTKIMGIEVKAVSSISNLNNIKIIIASSHYRTMEKQLKEMGVTEYEIYNSRGYFNIPELVYNPYVNQGLQTDTAITIAEINDVVYAYKKNGIGLFNHVEIETINRCNGKCSFCPVRVGNDRREFFKMTRELFEKIILELAEKGYSGRLALFSNNEPFLDNRIIEFHRYAREKLPLARIHLCTNGTLLTLDSFKEIVNYLDELIIDNYNQELKVLDSLKEIVDYCNDKTFLKEKVTIVLRKQDEILTSRGGDAPNKKNYNCYGDASCILPFEQMIIQPDGKVSLCCNDALGQMTMGDINIQSLEDVWYGENFEIVRSQLIEGRKKVKKCINCDTLYLTKM